MHTKMIDIAFFCKRDRIIEVLGILSVDRHGLKMCEIHPAISVGIKHMIRNTSCLCDDLRREL